MKKYFLAFIFHFALYLPFSAVASEERVALVVGNANYRTSPLKNPTNDAKDIAKRLRALGFLVIERVDLTHKQIGPALREFRTALKPGATGLFFYAGHGLQIKGENYLPTVDADIQGEDDVPQQSLAMRQVMDVLADAKTQVNLVFLDACRDNPYARSFRSVNKGLSRENAPSGTIISFATRPGSVAQDGRGRNGLYTGALLEAMTDTSQPIELVLKRVVASVKSQSKSQQEPWMEGSLEGDFCFGRCGLMGQAAGQGQSKDAEILFWDSIWDSRSKIELQAYLDQYPSGVFSALAKNRLGLLEASASPPPASSTTLAVPPASTAIPVTTATSSQKPPPPTTAAAAKFPPLDWKDFDAFRDCGDCPEMRMLPSAMAQMGSVRNEPSRDDELPRHPVVVESFAISATEVTEGQWRLAGMPALAQSQGDRFPVSNVTWEEANQFAARMSQLTGRRYRLPTEAEWEYAARAGSETDFFFGDESGWVTLYGLSALDVRRRLPVEVQSYRPNAWGLLDIVGNVSEWVLDCYESDYTSAPTSSRPELVRTACTDHVFRGGSYLSVPDQMRSSFRMYGGSRRPDVGFRVVVQRE